MASIFDGIGKKISQTGQDAIRKTKDMAEVARLNSYISDEEEHVHTYLYEIGKSYYEDNRENSSCMYQEQVKRVTSSLARIEELNNEIRKIKNIQICGKCGAQLSAESTFCSSCGAKMELFASTDAGVVVPAGDGSQYKTCPACGREVKAASAFCPSCGGKV